VARRDHAMMSDTAVAATLQEVRGATADIERARRVRDEHIARAFREGVSVPAIAEASGLTRGRVYQILGNR
jgi:hypothetical protein